MSDIEKALTVLRGFSSGDAALATRHIDPDRYVEHDPHVGNGIEGVRRHVDQIASDQPRLKVIRAYQDGCYVFTQADGLVQGDGTFFDVFRFEDGLIVEHWGFAAKAEPPNRSGHTQVDNPTHGEATERHRALVRDYYEPSISAADTT